MIEGKIQKRIKEIDFGLDALNEEFHPKIAAIIEDAKKEFPKVYEVKDEEGNTFGQAETPKEIMEWFVKYFGSE